MFSFIKHIYRRTLSERREKQKDKNRSPHWRMVKAVYLQHHNTCEGCGTLERLQVHHRKPFYLFPELELLPENLIALCMTRNECHLLIGHGDSFHHYNPNVVEDAKEANVFPETRDVVIARAKANRLPEPP